MMRRTAALLCLLLTQTFSRAQEGAVAMADGLRSNGKIYVVVAVILTIFIGIIVYLVRLDRKITKMEKQAFIDKSFDLKK